MANTKISALPSATTPLDGTEVIPLVQSGATKKVANNDLRPKQIQSNATSGVLQIAGPTASQTRVMTTPDANFSAARTDAGQTFLGQQTLIEDATNATPITLGSNGGLGDSTQILYRPRQAFLAPIAATKGVVTLGAGGNEFGDYFIETTSGGVRTSKLRVESVGNIYALTGNFVISTSGKGIDFSATSQASGMTSELLNDYEEGTWTVTPTGGNCSSVSLSNGTYTKVGRLVTLFGRMSATLTTTATETYIVFNVPINMSGNTSRAVGSVCHTLSTAFPGLGVVIDNSGGEASSVSLDIPSTQVTKVNGTAFTADFTFTYEAA
jgi:hypothetical protein